MDAGSGTRSLGDILAGMDKMENSVSADDGSDLQNRQLEVMQQMLDLLGILRNQALAHEFALSLLILQLDTGEIRKRFLSMKNRLAKKESELDPKLQKAIVDVLERQINMLPDSNRESS